jgi:hypothetical protein
VTERNRHMLVEILRCAADVGGIGRALHDLGYRIDGPWQREAVAAWESVAFHLSSLGGWTYGDVCLEAAARVEEGSHP